MNNTLARTAEDNWNLEKHLDNTTETQEILVFDQETGEYQKYLYIPPQDPEDHEQSSKSPVATFGFNDQGELLQEIESASTSVETLLTPASGFQSAQFRQIENKLMMFELYVYFQVCH